jgi:hypothetical protein
MYDEEATPDHPGFLPSHEGIAYLAHQQYLVSWFIGLGLG